jgi:hypothetical protein
MALLNSTAQSFTTPNVLTSTPAPNPNPFQSPSFMNVPSIPRADGTGLPSSRIPGQLTGNPIRNIMHWYVPEVGLINMYVNPQKVSYNSAKLLNKERTKGGYVVQYWGEELTTLTISGHTGSSGVEGLDVLYEIYRSEQYTFDPIGLTMAAANSITGIGNAVNSALGNLVGLSNTISNATTGLLGLDPASQNILPSPIPSLASLALGIELYYTGWVFRGYFNSFQFTESVERLGFFDYDINFTVTQRRGYRTNSFGWQHSANYGPSNVGPGGPPLTFTSVTGT